MSDWTRTAPDRVERDGYRIDKSHAYRLLHAPTPVYHCYAPDGTFLGVVGGDPERAKARCDAHRAERAARP